MGGKVPNPKQAWLKQLRADYLARMGSIKGALDQAAKDFGGNEVISGAWRDKEAPGIVGRKGRVNRLADAVLEAIDAEIRATPEEVTEGEAQMYRRLRSGRLG